MTSIRAVVLLTSLLAVTAATVSIVFYRRRKVLLPSSLPPPTTTPTPTTTTTTKTTPSFFQLSDFLKASQHFDFFPTVQSELHHTLRRISREYCPQLFADVPDEAIVISQITGGITNLLWKLQGPRASILVRAYGKNTSAFIQRELECAVLKELSDAHFGPTLFGTFSNGRVEGYFEGAVPFESNPQDMKLERFQKLIAKEMKRMHSTITVLQAIPDQSPQLFPMLCRFMAAAREVQFDNDDSLLLAELDLVQFEQEELAFLNNLLQIPSQCNRGDVIAFSSVFAHNDLLGGNILHLPHEGRVQFIDFEYGAFNFVAFDVANHFCEYAGFAFIDAFPSDEEQARFWRAYCGEVEDEETIRVLVQWSNRFALAANALWFLWAVYQARHSSMANTVDFMAYAHRRRGGYFARKVLLE